MIASQQWSGTCDVWLDPPNPPAHADITATTSQVLDGKTTQIDYRSSVKGKRSDGVMLVGTDIGNNKPCLTWIDTYHTGGNVMLFATDADGSLIGNWDAGGEVWRWRIRIEEGDELRIRHFIITPAGEEGPAIEVILRAA
ncbi:MAG TPA: DUF1579 family protein [Thermoanaerobaculia bacterium]|nr:DUF1579 family protein [Thermoanaerobaculia bacterium]